LNPGLRAGRGGALNGEKKDCVAQKVETKGTKQKKTKKKLPATKSEKREAR